MTRLSPASPTPVEVPQRWRRLTPPRRARPILFSRRQPNDARDDVCVTPHHSRRPPPAWLLNRPPVYPGDDETGSERMAESVAWRSRSSCRQTFHLLPESQIPRLRGGWGRGGVVSWVQATMLSCHWALRGGLTHQRARSLLDSRSTVRLPMNTLIRTPTALAPFLPNAPGRPLVSLAGGMTAILALRGCRRGRTRWQVNSR